MILIGLRNPGEKYKKTRHNVGAIVLEYLVKEMGGEFVNDKFTNCEKAKVGELDIYLPNTYMNLSGESVYKVLKGQIKSLEKFCVFFDDVTLPVGKYKISVGEGASSHNGIKSIVENIQSLGLTKDDFVRVRIGVGKMVQNENGKESLYEPGPEKLSDFVLSNLNNLDVAQIQGLSKEILEKLNN